MRQLFLFIIAFIPFVIQAQSLSPRVVASGGGYGSNTEGSISYTLGELATTTESTMAGTLTQGFQQPESSSNISTKEPSSENAGMFIYPNPGHGFSNIRYTLPETSGSIEIYDLKGKRLSVHRLSKQEGIIDTRDMKLAAGVYFVIFQSGEHIQKDKMIILR